MKIKIDEVERYPFWQFRLATEEECTDEVDNRYLVDIPKEEIEEMTKMVVEFEKMQDRLEELYCSKVDEVLGNEPIKDK